VILLVRHASAGERDAWEGDDRERPLDKYGRTQARELVDRLEPYRIDAIISSPAVRCIQTVEPLARKRRLELDVRKELGLELQETAGAELLRALASGDTVVVCGHGGLEQAVPDADRWGEGDTLILGPGLEVQGTA
jgi:8-oxo-(d)GTP phosphatase